MLRRAATTVLALAAIAGIWAAVRFKKYVDQSPEFCTNCHRATPEFAAWTGGQHAGTACQKCHHAGNGLAILRTFLVSGAPAEPKGKHAEVRVGACAACHLSHDPNWPQVGAARGHRIHAVEKKIGCVECHAAGIHRFTPATESCRRCHGEHTVNVHGMHKVHCFACHDFLHAQQDLRPTRRDCLRCHRAEGVLASRFPEDAPMQFACAACHKPHAAAAAEMVPCLDCHQETLAAGLHAEPKHQVCGECHRAHGWRSERDDCLRCHKGMASHKGDKPCGACHGWDSKTRPKSPEGH